MREVGVTMDELRDRVIEAVWQGRTYLELPDGFAAGYALVAFALPAPGAGVMRDSVPLRARNHGQANVTFRIRVRPDGVRCLDLTDEAACAKVHKAWHVDPVTGDAMPDPTPTDEQLGAAMRKVAAALGQTEVGWAWYARVFVRWSENETMMANFRQATAPRVRFRSDPPGRVDGFIERLIEMMTGRPATVDDEAAP